MKTKNKVEVFTVEAILLNGEQQRYTTTFDCDTAYADIFEEGPFHKEEWKEVYIVGENKDLEVVKSESVVIRIDGELMIGLVCPFCGKEHVAQDPELLRKYLKGDKNVDNN